MIDDKYPPHKMTQPLFGMILLAAALIIAGSSIGHGLQTFRNEDRTVSVKGLAERDVTADLAIWTLSHTTTGNDLAAVQGEIEKNREKITTFLKNAGFTPEEIGESPLQLQDLLASSYRPEGAADARYIITHNIRVRTGDIDKLERSVNGVGALLRDGVTLANTQPPSYLFTKLNDIKTEMLAEAIKNARAAADEFARDAHADVGRIKNASQGVFQIMPRDELGYESNTTQKFQKVRVVTTISFYLD